MMPLRYHVLTLMLLLFGGSNILLAQIPANDSCAGAVVISAVPFSYAQNTRLATPDPADPVLLCADSGGGKTVWFVYTADSTRTVMFSTTRSSPADYDIAMGLYTGSCGSLVEVECTDDSIPGSLRAATLAYPVQTGITYYLQIAEWNGGGPSGGIPTGGDLVLDVFPWEPLPLYHPAKSGSVAGGDSIVLNNSIIKDIIVPSSVGDEEAEENRQQILLPTPADVRPAAAPAGSNFVKDASVSSVLSPPAHPVVWKNHKGNTATGFIPPDPIMAVGPNHVMGLVNSSFMVWDKNDSLLATQSLNTWFSNVFPSPGYSDPQVLYDHFAHRWVITGLATSGSAGILLSVSDDDDPFGTWYNWSLPAGLGDSATGNLPDYPQLGYDSLAYYVTTRDFNPAFLYSRVRIIEKTQLFNNDAGPVDWTDIWDFREPDHTWAALDGIRPSIIYGSPGEHYLVNASPYTLGTFFTVWTIHDPIGTPTITGENIPVVEYLSAGDASQLGGGTAVDAGGSVIRHKAVYRDSSLWMAHSIRSGTGDAFSAVRYVRVNPHTGTNLEDVAMGADGHWYYYPALMVDGDQNVVVTYTRSGLTEYPGAFVAGHKATDPPGLSASIGALAAGKASYIAVGGGRNRWGDYMGIGLDPSDSLAVWVNTEYAAGVGTWETRIAMVKFTPLPGASIVNDVSSLAFENTEINDTSLSKQIVIANDGTDTLVIGAIDLPDSNFKFVAAPSLPLKLESFQAETLLVRFIPEDRGSFADSIVLHSNDTVRPALAIPVAGLGYIIDPAVSGTLYASSGVQDSGRLRTINPLDATGSAIGTSGYSQLLNIRVHPTTGEIMGLATTSLTTAAVYDVVRVSSSQGDAHSIGRINLNFLKGMAYRGDTLFVTRITGGVYRVDLVADSTELVASTGLQLSAIDFNPVTGELWAGVKGGSPVDGIYKISLPSGTPTLVGATGFGVPTVDIAFDANGTLFGLIGSGLVPNQLAIIDTLSGGGTIIGPTGFSTGQGITFHPDVANPVVSYHLFQTWNLMSVPLNLPDKSLGAIFPPAMTQSTAYGFNGGFVKTDTLENRVGYWVKIASAGAHSLIGIPDSTDTVGLQKRWNLVGTNSFPAPVGSITTDPPAILVTGFYAYNDTGYVVASDLEPGRGYWVKANSAGTMHFNVPSIVPAAARKNTIREYLEGISSIVIEDEMGHHQALYFGAAEKHAPSPESFDMPPVLPEAPFDARFASGRMVETHELRPGADLTFPIRILSPGSSVTVTWNIKGDESVVYSLGSGSPAEGGGSVKVMENRGSVVLPAADAATLRLMVDTRGVPKEFALGQNYPNPFNPTTTITYQLPSPEWVNLVVYNTLGERVMTVVDGPLEAGYHTARILTDNLASGVYFYRITAGSFTSARKMILLR